jgi:hypothetical protein
VETAAAGHDARDDGAKKNLPRICLARLRARPRAPARCCAAPPPRVE